MWQPLRATGLVWAMFIFASASADATQTFDQPVGSARSARNASYDITVRLDPATRTLRGREVIRWRNISTRTTSELQLHLYWNAWRNAESTWLRESSRARGRQPQRSTDSGSVDVTAVRVREPSAPTKDVTQTLRFIAPDDGNTADRTVAVVSLPFPVGPREDIQIEIEWTSQIPFPFTRLRTGWIDDYFFIAQWFPKVGVLEDEGWNTHQFHYVTEFYADYGVYDVRITTPRAYVVGASGSLVESTDNADGTRTQWFRGEDIHDFAWVASPRFIDERRIFTHPTLPRVTVRLLLQPEHRGAAERYFVATTSALKYFGEWFGPYPYEQITVVDPAYGSGSDGMEYPMLFSARGRWLSPSGVTEPELVAVHEAAHQWWFGMVGTNEFEHAWMDEGLAQFAAARVIEAAFQPNDLMRRYFGGFIPWAFRGWRVPRSEDEGLARYRASAETDVPATPTFRYWPASANTITYYKTALWLHTLERQLGWTTLQRAMAVYFDRWKFRHPGPDDLFRTINEVSGQDLTWFFDQVYRRSVAFDYAIQDLSTTATTNGFRTVVVAERLGEGVFPVEVMTTFANGERTRERWDGRDKRKTFTYERSDAASSANVDPAYALRLDVNRTNNRRTVKAGSWGTSSTWAARWMGWLEEVMLTYAFFF